jgi:hypothetical protein
MDCHPPRGGIETSRARPGGRKLRPRRPPLGARGLPTCSGASRSDRSLRVSGRDCRTGHSGAVPVGGAHDIREPCRAPKARRGVEITQSQARRHTQVAGDGLRESPHLLRAQTRRHLCRARAPRGPGSVADARNPTGLTQPRQAWSRSDIPLRTPGPRGRAYGLRIAGSACVRSPRRARRPPEPYGPGACGPPTAPRGRPRCASAY